MYAEEELIKFKKSCLNSKGSVFENNFIKIGTETNITDFQGKKYLKINVHVKNISNITIENCSLEYQKSQDFSLWTKPNKCEQ